MCRLVKRQVITLHPGSDILWMSTSTATEQFLKHEYMEPDLQAQEEVLPKNSSSQEDFIELAAKRISMVHLEVCEISSRFS